MPPLPRPARRARAALLSLASLSSLAPLAAARAQDPWRPDRRTIVGTLDSVARAAMEAERPPAMTVIVVRGGDTLLARADGYADLENAVPATLSTVYGLG